MNGLADQFIAKTWTKWEIKLSQIRHCFTVFQSWLSYMIKLLYLFSTEKLKEMKKKKQHQNGADDGVGIICAM